MKLSAIHVLQKSIQASNFHFLKIVKLSALEGIFYFLIIDACRQYFLYTLSLIQQHSIAVGPFNPATLGLICTSFLSALIFTFLFTLRSHDVFSGHSKKTPLWSYVGPLTMPLVVEGLRGLTGTLLRVFLLILPALYYYIRIKYLNHIVLFDKDYQASPAGDAIASSHQLTQGKTMFLMLFLFELIFGIITYFIEGEFNKYPVFTSPLGWITLAPLILLFYVYYQSLNYAIFRELFLANKGALVESHVQTK